MPPFQYEPHANPYAASIGDLILRRGDIAARAAETVAAANARAAEIAGAAHARAADATGQIWGDTARAIGQDVGGVVRQLSDPRRKMDALQLSEAQSQNRSRNIFEAELKNPANYNEDGSVNDAAIADRLKKQDVGAWQQWNTISAANQKNALDLRLKVQEIGKNTLEIQQKQQALGQAQGEYLGKLAYNALGVLKEKPDDPLHARDTALAAIARAASDPYSPVNEAAAKNMLLHVAQAGPSEIAQTFESFIPPELRGKLDKEAADTAKSKAEAAKANAEATGTLPPTPAQKETARHNLEMERIGGLNAGRAEAAQAETKRHNLAVEGQNEAAPKLSPEATDLTAKQFAMTGQLPPMGMGKQGAAVRTNIINRAAELYKGLDLPSQVAAYKANQGSLSKLQVQRDAIRAFESTAKKNIDIFLEQAGKVVDTGSPLANTLVRQVSGKILGSPDQAAYDAARQVAVNEIAKITSNPNLSGTLSDSARHEVDAFNPQSATLAQSVKVMRLLKQDMDNRATSLDDQIKAIQLRIATPPGGAAPAAPAAPPGATPPVAATPSEGTTRTVGGKTLTWKTVNGTAGWYK